MAKRALLIGINDYPGTQNDLQGCVNDITNIGSTGFRVGQVAKFDKVLGMRLSPPR
jgi:hypothetical protein